MAEIFLFRFVCVTTIGACVFRCAGFGWRTFLFLGISPLRRKMNHYNQKKRQEETSVNDTDAFDELLVKSLAFFDDTELDEVDVEIPSPDRRHKIRMNRLFRERVGGSFLPFPEADNFYERWRSRLVIKLKINECFDCRKKRRREKRR